MRAYFPKLGLMLLGLSLGVVAAIPDAYAACTTPAGQEGDLRYDTSAKAVYVCNDTSWQAVGGTPDIQIITGATANASCGPSCTDTKTSTATCPATYKLVMGDCQEVGNSWPYTYAWTSTSFSCTVSVSNTARSVRAVASCMK